MKHLFLIIVFVFSGMASFAQGLTLYNMDFVPQSMRSNPAQIQQSNFHFSLFPILPNLDLSYVNNGFVLADLLQVGAGTVATPDKFLGAIEDKNFISTKLNIDYLSFGFKVKKHYFMCQQKNNTQ